MIHWTSNRKYSDTIELFQTKGPSRVITQKGVILEDIPDCKEPKKRLAVFGGGRDAFGTQSTRPTLPDDGNDCIDWSVLREKPKQPEMQEPQKKQQQPQVLQKKQKEPEPQKQKQGHPPLIDMLVINQHDQINFLAPVDQRHMIPCCEGTKKHEKLWYSTTGDAWRQRPKAGFACFDEPDLKCCVHTKEKGGKKATCVCVRNTDLCGPKKKKLLPFRRMVPPAWRNGLHTHNNNKKQQSGKKK
eukprot:TRINITY_DN28844_c0_g1_i1.p1 TRINITY_DN28844_c0_g1~~TRINITY_DN28844_c0_g1_i1.p1  ORF type:complete len:243 (+),score=19.66 TRINITY_DN28844_c0_g1_i1:3-731(+)